jgi:hypothetical protein
MRYEKQEQPTLPTGSYSISLATGTMAAGLAAASEVFQFLWTSTTSFAVIEEIRFDGAGGIAAFTPGFWKMAAFIARAWTVAGTGGTAATITTNNAKFQTRFGTTLLGEARIATTAALTAGTKTLDAQPIGSCMGGVTATAGFSLPQGQIYQGYGTTPPIVLAANEGIAIQVTVPATGTWTGGYTIRWDERAGF